MASTREYIRAMNIFLKHVLIVSLHFLGGIPATLCEKLVKPSLVPAVDVTYDAEFGNRIGATLVGDECSHHCAIPASLLLLCFFLLFIVFVVVVVVVFFFTSSFTLKFEINFTKS